MIILIKIDRKYRWDKYKNYNCEPYITGKYNDLKTARWACIKDRRCSAISVLQCDPNQVVGLCTENKIGLGHEPGYCIYKKGDTHECICIFSSLAVTKNKIFYAIHISSFINV